MSKNQCELQGTAIYHRYKCSIRLSFSLYDVGMFLVNFQLSHVASNEQASPSEINLQPVSW